jgi:hypothetical protein
MEHGTTIIPSVLKEPLAIGAPTSEQSKYVNRDVPSLPRYFSNDGRKPGSLRAGRSHDSSSLSTLRPGSVTVIYMSCPRSIRDRAVLQAYKAPLAPVTAKIYDPNTLTSRYAVRIIPIVLSYREIPRPNNMSAKVKINNMTLRMPFILKKAASNLDRSVGVTSECS